MSHINKYEDFLISAFKKIRDKEGEKTIFKIINALYENFKKNEYEEKYTFKINKNRNLLCKKFLFQKILDQNLILIKKSIMIGRAKKEEKIIVPIPRNWACFLKGRKANISSYYYFFFLKELTFNTLRGVKEIFKLIKYKTNEEIFNSNYLLILSFPEKSLIQPKGGFTFINYLRKKSNNKIVNYQITNKKNSADFNLKEYPFFSIPPKNRLKFLNNSLFILFNAILNGLKGKWYFCYLLPEIIKLAYYNLLENKPKEIIFSQSSFIYRPIWTAFSKNSSLLYYSTNNINYVFSDLTNTGFYPGFKTMSWDKYYTFSNSHGVFLEKLGIKKNKILIEKNCIPLTDSNKKISIPKGFNVAIFSLEPFSDEYLSSIGRPLVFNNLNISKKIISDTLLWCQKNKANLIFKRKKNLDDKRINKVYDTFLKSLQNKIFFVDEDISVTKICKKVDCIISQPFTSTALFAREVNKPSIYYDSTHLFKKNQDASDGIELLQGKKQLYSWLNNIYFKSQKDEKN